MTTTGEQVPADIKASQTLKIRGLPSHTFAVRDDSTKAEIAATGESPDSKAPTWANGKTAFSRRELRELIEPWLSALLQSEHLSLLAGSGLTNAVHFLAKGENAAGMSKAKLGDFDQVLDNRIKVSAKAAGRGDGNLEDQLRVAFELLRGLQAIPADTSIKFGESDGKAGPLASDLSTKTTAALKGLASGVLLSEKALLSHGKDDTKQVEAIRYLVSFLMSFASRPGTRDRLHIFTTNYDRYIETGAELAGMRLIDRFVGSLSPVFRSSRLDVDLHYNPPGIRGEPRYLEGVARFTKLHGSLDWVEQDRHIRRVALPLGAESPELYMPGQDFARMMVYPNAAKDRETSGFPYVELFRDFAAAACRPNHTLFTYGYSFGDEHINRVIDDMLTIPSTHLVIIALGDSLDIIESKDYLKHSQVTVLLGKQLGDLKELVENYLPKPAIDRASIKMAELVKARDWTTKGEPDDRKPEPGGANADPAAKGGGTQ